MGEKTRIAPLLPETDEKPFRFVSPDYFRMVPWEGPGLKPVGYGVESIESLVDGATRTNEAGKDLSARQATLASIDACGLLATPGNSSYNELVTEGARISVEEDGAPVVISYEPEAGVRRR